LSDFLAHKNSDEFPLDLVGGKASNLFQLEKLGVKIPDWTVIPSNVLMDQLSSTDVDEAKKELSRVTVPKELLEDIQSFFDDNYQSKSYAVRSSALDEDGKLFSFAGQFDTFLHVPYDQLEEKIKAVWNSVVSERVLNYRRENDLPEQFGIGVIIQEMIPSEVSGVAFGMDPVSGDPRSKVISSVYGLGEGLVSGELDADTFTFNSGEITQTLVKKTHAVVANNNSGIVTVAVEKEKQDLPSINDKQVNEIAALLDRLENKIGSPQDIEFAYYNHQLYLLQTRPITSRKKQGEYTLWDNSNIVESYPGITTPLTFSFILKMYEMVYRQFVGLMGVKENEIEQHANVFANTLGLVRGRVYYNLLSWYKMLAMLPGYKLNAEYMENMMGVKERFELEEDYKMSKGQAWLRIVLMVFKMIRLQRNLSKERKRFMAHLNGVMNRYHSMDFDQLSPTEIIAKYNEFEKTLLLEWKAPLINDFFAMIWFGILQKQTKKLCPDEPNIHNDLLCGSRDIISVEPIHRSIEIAKKVMDNESANDLFNNNTPDKIWEELSTNKYPEIKTEIDSYIAKFGERCVGELKLETISYSQNPVLFVKVIKSYVEQKITKKKTHSGLDSKLRSSAESTINEKLQGKPIKKRWFYYVLNKARDLVSNRENLRYERTRGFGMVRTMFSALGNKLSENGLLANPRDIFYLKLGEIKQLENHQFSDALKSKINDRKSDFSSYKEQPIPEERFFTYGNDFSDQYIYSKEKLEPISGDLSGIGCCPGRVKAKVQMVLDPNSIDSLNGDVLVTSSTDPGWVTLFPTASAIIVERGSLLSHSAIVSREMGIPCIVSVSGLLRTLKTGDEIEMDGSTGKIKILNNG
tara:strand:+ start:7497 stop:10079 length:2583 start_codon:yes stop_codon:yes gene_type:complete